jgi:radical SAM protein with 4Fe4S-binding SPASM domain
MITNGTFLAKNAAGLVQAGLEAVEVSLDGTEEAHDRYRGKGSYQAAIDGIRAVRAERDRLGIRPPLICANYTMMPDNAEELPALARQVKEAGGDGTLVGRFSYVPREMGQAHERSLQTLFQIRAPSWEGFSHELLGDPKSVKLLVEEMKNSSEFKGFVALDEPGSYWTPDDYYRYYRDPSYVLPSDRSCHFPWDGAGVCPNGDVVACPDFPDYVVGNLYQQSLREIWNGEKLRRFRRTLAEHRRFPICSICCHLYED